MRTRFPRRAAVPAVRRVAERAARNTANGTVAPSDEDSAPLFGNGMADKVPLILFSYDLERHHLLHCNRHCQTVLGYSNQELLAMDPALGKEMLHVDSLAQFQRNDLHQLLTGDRAMSWDCRLRHRDGSYRWSYTLRGRVVAPPVFDAATGRLFVATSDAATFAQLKSAAVRKVRCP